MGIIIERRFLYLRSYKKILVNYKNTEYKQSFRTLYYMKKDLSIFKETVNGAKSTRRQQGYVCIKKESVKDIC